MSNPQIKITRKKNRRIRSNPLTQEEMKTAINRGLRTARFFSKNPQVAKENPQVAKENPQVAKREEREEMSKNNRKDKKQENLFKRRRQAPSPSEREEKEERIAEAASAILQVEIETGEVLNGEQAAAVINYYADNEPRILPASNARTWIVAEGQERAPLYDIDENGIPEPAWLVSVQNDVESFMRCARDRIIPFELIDRIRYHLDPTPEQIDEQRAARQARQIQADRVITNIDDLLRRIKLVVIKDARYQQAQKFATYFRHGEGSVFIQSLEAPARMQSSAKDFVEEYDEYDYADSDPTAYAHSAVSRGFEPLEPLPLQTPLNSILRLAANADDILRRGFGIQARFAVWSPYGPGPGDLRRLFLIYDGVIEPEPKARMLNADGNVELVDALNILTEQIEGRVITADAYAEAHVVRKGAFAQAVEENVTGWSPGAVDQEQFIPAIETATGQSLLNIPIRDAYRAWLAALWTQSHLRHEDQISPDILAVHCRMIEFILGFRGERFRRYPPTFYQLNIETPLRAVYDVIARSCAKGVDIAGIGATSFCNLLGVDNQDVVAIAQAQDMPPQEQADRLTMLVANARTQARIKKNQARRNRIMEGAGSAAQSIFNSAKITTTAVFQSIKPYAAAAATQGFAASRRGSELGFAAASSAASSASEITLSVVAQVAPAATAGQLSIRTADAGGGGGNVEYIVAVVDSNDQPIAASIPSSELNTIQTIVSRANEPEQTIANVVPQIIAEPLVGGGVAAIRCQTDLLQFPTTILVEPVVELPAIVGGGGEIVIPQQITTVTNAVVISQKAPEREILEIVQRILTSLERGQARGIYNNKKTTHRTKKYRGRKGRKGCKRTKKGCKGRKGRGKGSKRRGTSNKGMPTDTMQILKQKLKL